MFSPLGLNQLSPGRLMVRRFPPSGATSGGGGEEGGGNRNHDGNVNGDFAPAAAVSLGATANASAAGAAASPANLHGHANLVCHIITSGGGRWGVDCRESIR